MQESLHFYIIFTFTTFLHIFTFTTFLHIFTFVKKLHNFYIYNFFTYFYICKFLNSMFLFNGPRNFGPSNSAREISEEPIFVFSFLPI